MRRSTMTDVSPAIQQAHRLDALGNHVLEKPETVSPATCRNMKCRACISNLRTTSFESYAKASPTLISSEPTRELRSFANKGLRCSVCSSSRRGAILEHVSGP